MSTIPEERIKILIQKYLTDTLTDAEKQELANLSLEYPRVMEILDQMETEGLASPGFQQRQEAALQRSLERARAIVNSPGNKQRILSLRKRPKIVEGAIYGFLIAAAAIAIFIFGPTIWRSDENKTVATQPMTPPPPISPNTNKIAPGGNKAVLTMADGQSIRLDSLPGQQLPGIKGIGPTLTDSGTLSYQNLPTSPGYNTLTIPRGGQFKVILSDSTVVWLNNASSLHYPVAFSGKTREVSVTGQAYFEIAKDAARPFKVKVNDREVDVLGTSFCVTAYASEAAHTVLLTGKIAVKAPGHYSILAPGQKLDIGSWKLTKNVDVAGAIAWTKGEFDYRDIPLSELLKNIARWYDIELDLKGMSKDLPSTGLRISRYTPLSDILDILNHSGKFRMEGRKLIATT